MTEIYKFQVIRYIYYSAIDMFKINTHAETVVLLSLKSGTPKIEVAN